MSVNYLLIQNCGRTRQIESASGSRERPCERWDADVLQHAIDDALAAYLQGLQSAAQERDETRQSQVQHLQPGTALLDEWLRGFIDALAHLDQEGEAGGSTAPTGLLKR
jgi:hypothetical protein